MKKISYYSIFFDWLFDGRINTPIPTHPDFDLFKYNSPINETFLLKMFIKNGPLNHLLNDYNNLGVRYLERSELFFFIKSCVIGFKIKRKDIHYTPYRRTAAIFDKLKSKYPTLKDHEISLLAEQVEKMEDDKKNAIYRALGIEKKKKVTTKKKKKSTSKVSKSINLKSFISDNFELYPMESI